MGSNKTATATTGGPRVIDVFDGNGAPSGPNYLLFVDADRLADSLWDRSVVGWSPTPHAPILGGPKSSGSHCQVIHVQMGCLVERIGRNMLEAAAHAA